MRFFHYAVLFSAAAFCMTSCSNDNDLDPTAKQEVVSHEGEETYMSLRLTLGNRASRADEGDANAYAQEEWISDPQLILIFNNGVLEQYDFYHLTSGADENPYRTQPIKTIVGEKTIYAIQGTDGFDIESELKVGSTTIKSLEDIFFNAFKENDKTGVLVPNNYSNPLLMFGKSVAKDVVKCTKEEAADKNLYPVVLYRASAKAQVLFDTSRFQAESENVNEHLVAMFSDARFMIAQSAKKMYVGQTHYYYQNEYDPNPTFATTGRFTQCGEKSEGSGTYSNYFGVDEPYDMSNLKETVTSFTVNKNASDYRNYTDYMAENFCEHPVTGNTTFALIQLTVTPDEDSWYKLPDEPVQVEGMGSIPSDENRNGNDFYVIARRNTKDANYIFLTDENYDIIYFKNQDIARYYMKLNNISEYNEYDKLDGYDVLCYTNGAAYYRVNIQNNPAIDVYDENFTDEMGNPQEVTTEEFTAIKADRLREKYNVQRNSFYQITIKSIKNLGAHEPGGVVPTDPDTPLEPEYWLVTEIRVAPWRVVEQGADL